MEMAFMIPTRTAVNEMINGMTDDQFKKVAVYVRTVQNEDDVATASEVAALTKKFNTKYEKAFRALAQ